MLLHSSMAMIGKAACLKYVKIALLDLLEAGLEVVAGLVADLGVEALLAEVASAVVEALEVAMVDVEDMEVASVVHLLVDSKLVLGLELLLLRPTPLLTMLHPEGNAAS